MALRALMKRKELNGLNKQLDELRAKAEGFEAREADIAQMIEEAESDEERTAVEEEITAFEQERSETETEMAGIEEKIRGIENELAEIEAAQAAPTPDPEPAEPKAEERGIAIMSKRNVFRNMDLQTREAMFARDDVQTFLGQVRTMIKEKRAITGADLLVPEVFLGLIRENIMDYSKLYKHVNVRQVGGNGKMVVMGTIPEAVWTDCCGALNELTLGFNDVEVDCWKVGGFFDLCNATVEDSDIDLASELLTVLGQAIGIALDKAILFGLGTRMPLGVFTRLAQTTAPAGYPATARPWVNLSTSNVKTIAASATGIALFKELLIDSAAAKGKYSRGEKVWVMNDTTYTTLKAEGLSINAAGVIVSGVEGTMPVVGGVVEVLDFLPNNVILGGYFDLYLLAERSGTKLAQSEHYRFVEDRTVFKGTARYDGQPAIAEAFVAIGINGTTPSASGVSFAPDTANTENSENPEG